MNGIHGSALELAKRLFDHARREGLGRVMPLWADGGSGASQPPMVPRRHVLAAYPSRVAARSVEELGAGGLEAWLRGVLPARGGSRLPLGVLFLAYDAGRAAAGMESTFPGPARAAYAGDAAPDAMWATYDGYLVGASEVGPWEAVGDVSLLLKVLGFKNEFAIGVNIASEPFAGVEGGEGSERGGAAGAGAVEEVARAVESAGWAEEAEAGGRVVEGGGAVESAGWAEEAAVEEAGARVVGGEGAVEGARAVEEIDLVDEAGRGVHAAGVREVLEGIGAGDFYQANLARRLEGRAGLGAAWGIYERFRSVQPAAFGVLWPLGVSGVLASGSPECLLAWDGIEGIAKSYPIKGTTRRGGTEAEDAAWAAGLVASAKDRAEHVMIVDLVRNDLGRVAEAGGVTVPRLMEVVPLATLQHLVSEVRAEVGEADLAAVVAALVPGGSITGAPKIAAMAAIDRLEPFRRGPYCGNLGLVFGGAEAVLSILIRTAFFSDKTVTYAVGGGVVADSNAEREWEETELKAAAFRRALGVERREGEAGGAAGDVGGNR